MNRSFEFDLLTVLVINRIIIFLIAGIGGIFNYVSPYHRPFSLADLSISYPLKEELFPTQVLFEDVDPQTLIC
jgi:hypothetical protein